MLQWNTKKIVMLAVATALSVAFAKFGTLANFTW
jgi:hypothetical protein